jgi:hypothetical protein
MINSLQLFLFYRKYDDIVSVNQESVVGADVEKVKKLMEESEADLNLVRTGAGINTISVYVCG